MTWYLRMFWRVVSHMNNTQRQQLLYFATGSASLPVSSDQEPCKYISTNYHYTPLFLL